MRQTTPSKPAPGRPLRVIQITDTHLCADPKARLMGLNTQTSLLAVLARLRQEPVPPDLVLATGDLVHDASPAGYRRLGAILASLGVPVYCLPGNHDQATTLAAILNEGRVRTVPEAMQGGWALLFMDSTLPDSDAGHLSETELERLATALERHRDLPTLICLHHNPVPVGSVWMDTMAVDNGDDLFALLDRHPQVRGLLWGHVHQVFEAERNGVRLMATPSTCIQFQPGGDTFALDPAPPGYRWLELTPEGGIHTGVRRLEGYPLDLDTEAGGY